MEILNVIEGSEILRTNIVGWVVLAVFAVSGVVTAIGIVKEKKSIVFVGLPIFIICFSLILLFTSYLKDPVGNEPNRYEVIITDPKHVIDATKYKVIEQRDKIIVLEEVK